MNTPAPIPPKSKIGSYLASARHNAALTQAQLAKRLGVTRSMIARIESGLSEPDFALTVRLATALNVPLEWFSTGRLQPAEDLAGLAVELHHYGIRDLRVTGARAPGAIRRLEELLPLILRNPRPSVRVIDALPYVLANNPIISLLPLELTWLGGWPLVERRFGWLCEAVEVLHRTAGFPHLPEAVERCAWAAVNIGHPTPDEPLDSLGVPGENPPLLWRRWRISYAGTLNDFATRAAELAGRVPG